MTAEEYEDFLRKGLGLSSRNKAVGADADIFRELERSYVEYQQNPASPAQIKNKKLKIPAALASYNKKAIKVAHFLQPVLDKYAADFYLNEEQTVRLNSLKTALKKTPTFEKIIEVITEAREIMTPSTKVIVRPSGFLSSPSYTYYVRETYNKFIHKFGCLEELEIVLYEIPYSIIGKYRYEAPKISTDGKRITVTVAQNQYYSPEGTVTGQPQPYEVLNSLDRRLGDAVQLYASWKKRTPPLILWQNNAN